MATEALSGNGAPVEGLSYRNLTGKNVKLIINYMEIYLQPAPGGNAPHFIDVTFSWGGGGGSQFKIPDDNQRFEVSDSPYLNFAFGKSLAYSAIQFTSRRTVTGSTPIQYTITEDIPSMSSKNLIGYYRLYSTGPFSVPQDPLAVPMEYIIAPDKRFSITGTRAGRTDLPDRPFIGPYNIVIITED